MGNGKTHYKPSNCVNFHDVALGDLIKAIFYQFGFDDTNNDHSNDDTTFKDSYIDGS